MKIYRQFLLVVWVVVALILSLAALMTLLGIEENWRGERDWAEYVREHNARGDRVDFQPLVPPLVPDDQNFAMTPLLAPLSKENQRSPEYLEYANRLNAKFKIPAIDGKKYPSFGSIADARNLSVAEWQAYLGKDVLEWLKRFDGELREISGATRRPYASFPIEYEKGIWANSPPAVQLGDLTMLYELRACAELQAGQTDRALDDAQTIFRLSDSLKNEPLIIPQIFRIMIWRYGLQVVWEGLEARRWTDVQMVVLQEDLGRPDFLKDLQLALHGERASLNATVAEMGSHPEMMAQSEDAGGSMKFKRFTPNGIFRRMQLNANLYYETYLFNIVDIPDRRIRKDVLIAGDDCIHGFMHKFLGVRIVNPYNLLTAIMIPAVSTLSAQSAYTQSTTDQALIACALERYRLANGQFPDALAKLVPAYLKEIPPDVVDGEPPHYRLNKDGTFFLYSDGWDGKDHGGKLMMKSDNGGVDIMKSDWVWSGKVE